MANDPLFRNIADPAERKRKLVENAQVVVNELRQLSTDSPDIFNGTQYLGQVIRELGDM